MRVIFTQIAGHELDAAVRYYELEYSGLGHKFKEEVKKAAANRRVSSSVVYRAGRNKEVPPAQVSLQIAVLRGRCPYSCHRGSPPAPETRLLGW